MNDARQDAVDELVQAAKDAREVIVVALTLLAHIEQHAPDHLAEGIRQFWEVLDVQGYRLIGTRLDRAITAVEETAPPER